MFRKLSTFVCAVGFFLPAVATADDNAAFQGKTAAEWGTVLLGDNPTTCAQAATALATFGEAGIPWLVKGLESTSPAPRFAALPVCILNFQHFTGRATTAATLVPILTTIVKDGAIAQTAARGGVNWGTVNSDMAIVFSTLMTGGMEGEKIVTEFTKLANAEDAGIKAAATRIVTAIGKGRAGN